MKLNKAPILGDSLVLCTDGLSGFVSDKELQRVVDQFVPQEGVYHLVERANENGGLDNTTTIFVRVQEVGSVDSTVDKNAAYPKALKELKAERIMPDHCEF